VDPGFSQRVDSQLQSVAVQPDGRILIGGNFNRVEDIARQGSARLAGATGALDRTFNPNADAFFHVGQTVLGNGNILIMGDFTRVGGSARTNLALLGPTGSAVSTFNPSPNDSVLTAQVLPDGKFMIGGPFSEIGTVSRRQLARLNANGSLDASFALAADNSVLTTALQTDGRLVLGGLFTSLGGRDRSRLARLQANGSLDASFAPEFDGAVFCVAVQADGKILVGGSFRSANGSPRSQLARLWPDGSLDTGFDVDLAGSGEGVFSIVPQCDGKILFSGDGFTTVAGVTRTQLARVDGAGRLDPTFNPFLENPGITFGTQNVFTALQSDGKVLLAGSFARINGVDRRSIARLENDPAGESLTAPAADRVEWRRGGSAPETQQVEFAVSTDGARTWAVLGNGTRIDGGWSLGGLSLPATGHLRARARVFGARFNGSGSLLESVVPFSLPSRVLVVHDGATTQAPVLINGQETAVDYGETRLGTPVLRAFTLANTGTASLQLTGFSVPPGFRVFNLPALPRTLEAGGSLTLPVQLTAAMPGDYAGPVVILTTADNSPEFRFPVAGRVTAPDIAVFEGADATGLEITSGQAAAIDFGAIIQGTPAVKTFTISNQGTAGLDVRQLTVPSGYEATSDPLPNLLAVGSTTLFRVRLTTLTVGTHDGLVVIASDDPDEPVFTFPITGSVFIPAPVATLENDRTTLNRQTGLREQRLTLTNQTTATVPAHRLLVTGLPDGITVANATERLADGTFVLLVREPMAPFSQRSLIVEYASPTRQPETLSPRITVEVVLDPPDDSAANEGSFAAVDRILALADGAILIEFTSVVGRDYECHYSHDGVTWKRSFPAITATGNRTRWIDRGPPRTDLPPTAEATRFYRVRELTSDNPAGG
jgi:uncharacterized delta-60 repeat protein